MSWLPLNKNEIKSVLFISNKAQFWRKTGFWSSSHIQSIPNGIPLDSLRFPKFFQSLWILSLGANMQVCSSKSTHRSIHSQAENTHQHTPLASVGWGSPLSAPLSECVSPFLSLSCGNTSTACMCVCIWVSVCVCVYVCVIVNGLCSLLLPPCWVFPSPWLLLPLSRSKLQGAGSSTLSASSTFSSLSFPSFIFSPLYPFCLFSSPSKIKLLARSHNARKGWRHLLCALVCCTLSMQLNCCCWRTAPEITHVHTLYKQERRGGEGVYGWSIGREPVWTKAPRPLRDTAPLIVWQIRERLGRMSAQNEEWDSKCTWRPVRMGTDEVLPEELLPTLSAWDPFNKGWLCLTSGSNLLACSSLSFIQQDT